MTDNYDETKEVAFTMVSQGGRFVHFLGAALQCADSENANKIKSAFPEYWEKYLEISNRIKANAKNTR